ncbi:MAG: PQQ-binding-like beta-propeller repeat protein [Cyanobacteria bacterium SID2]|nr:PQQ-binding-like beta-propeller repeat protein [Cyanobacteria bacterium SID2]MBP0006468.1 PQQ-binding-like beta-propeller repeat protein [Cyanobacteria bacterium SBC]
MGLSRRILLQQAASFAFGAIVPPVLRRKYKGNAPKLVTPISFADTVTQQVNELLTGRSAAVPPDIELLVPTYLGNAQRRFYGRGTPKGLNEIDRFYLGSGLSVVGGSYDTWSGAGWTGQPTLIRDRGKLYLIIGAYDHSLRKIDLETNRVVWQYQFDDILKGSSSVYIDETAEAENRLVVLQGSRRGVDKSLSSGFVPSFRAVSFRTGKELWRLNIRATDSYSRDNDSTAIDLGNGTIFNVGENAIGYFISSSTKRSIESDGFRIPEVIDELQLYEAEDVGLYAGNLVAESSPAIFNDRLYLASGGGRIYGIDLETRQIVWQFRAGGDLNGTISISRDGKLFSTLDREKIPGRGGAFKLDPNQPNFACVEWFLPTLNLGFGEWQGGITGSVALNDEYRAPDIPPLFATNAIDGNLYIGSQTQVTGEKVAGPLLEREYDTPVIVFQKQIGASISTPIFTDGNRLVSAGYNGIRLFQLGFEISTAEDDLALRGASGNYYRVTVEEIAAFKPGGSFESTPMVWDGIVRVCSRDGWMYTLG